MTNPLLIHLHMLQLEGYSAVRFFRWWIRNPLKFRVTNKTPLVWTNKAKFIYVLSGGFWPLMFVALALLKPYEIINRFRVKSTVRTKVDSLKKQGLRVIGITGSYGKSSTKEVLYQLLSKKYKVLRTPESYNTVFGIAKVVDLELDAHYQFFICEMGAYKRGEIEELCSMVNPDFGMLTGINEQHLERFGSLENTVLAKFELVDYVLGKSGHVVVNAGNDLVKANLRGSETLYGAGEYAHPLDQNTEGAVHMAKILGMIDLEIHSAIKTLGPATHRLSLIKRGDMTIIDDAFSSNVDGFKAAVKYLKSFPGWKVIITPGIAELGGQSNQIHMELGRLLIGVDQVILVGKNERTNNLEKGMGMAAEYVAQVNDALAQVKHQKATVLFENDLPDNY